MKREPPNLGIPDRFCTLGVSGIAIKSVAAHVRIYWPGGRFGT